MHNRRRPDALQQRGLCPVRGQGRANLQPANAAIAGAGAQAGRAAGAAVGDPKLTRLILIAILCGMIVAILDTTLLRRGSTPSTGWCWAACWRGRHAACNISTTHNHGGVTDAEDIDNDQGC